MGTETAGGYETDEVFAAADPDATVVPGTVASDTNGVVVTIGAVTGGSAVSSIITSVSYTHSPSPRDS